MARKIRICYVIGTLDLGGTEGQLVRLVTRLDREVFSPIVCSLSAGGPYQAPLEDAGIPVRVFGLRGFRQSGNPLKVLTGLLRFAAFIRRIRPDIVHGILFHASVPATFAARLTGRAVVVASRRSTGFFKTGMPHRAAAERIANWFTRCFVANAEAVRADTIATEGVDPSRVVVIHNGIDASQYDRIADPELRASLSLDGRAPVIGVLANFHPYKGHAALISALPAVRERLPDSTVILIGDGAQRPAIEAAVDACGLRDAVRFLGARQDIPALLAQIDVLVHPSTEEGLCNAILEAMAAGKPVVALNIGGNSELVVHGYTGLLLEPGDRAALAAAIIDLGEDLNQARRMGERGRARVVESFSVERMVHRHEVLYRQLLAGWPVTGPAGPR